MTDVIPAVEKVDEDAVPLASATRPPGQRALQFAGLREVLVLYVVCIAGALTLAAVIVALTGGSWRDVYTSMLNGSLLKPGRWGNTLSVAAPMLFVALGTVVSSRAGLINIGQEGQLVIGACFAAFVGTRLDGPGPLVLVALLVAGFVGGAIWSAIAGLLRYWRNVPEVLSTLLLVAVAANLMGFALQRRWLLLAPSAGRANRNQVSEPLAQDRRLPRVEWFGNDFPVSVIIAVLLALLVLVVLERSIPGFRLRILGRNRVAARRAGVRERRYGMAAMAVSGGFAGLAGGMMLATDDFAGFQLVAGFGAGIGYAGLLVALVARQRVLASVFVAFIFGGLRTGSQYLKSSGLPSRIADVVQGLLVLSLLLPPAIVFVTTRRRALAAARTRV